MRPGKRIWFLLIFPALALVLALVSESLYFSDLEYRFMTGRFNRILHEKEKTMDDFIRSLEPLISRPENNGLVPENAFQPVAGMNDITVLQYLDNKLVYWSDNGFDVPLEIDDSTFSRPLIFLQNGWFVPDRIHSGNQTIIGLLRVRTDYGFENEIIRSGFNEAFRMPEGMGFSTEGEGSQYRIFNSGGDFLFSLNFPETKSNTVFIFVPLFFWGLLFIFLLIAGNEFVRIMASRKRVLKGILICLLLYGGLYLLLTLTRIPGVVFSTDMFSSYLFSYSGFIPSLGHLAILAVLSSHLSLILYRFITEDIAVFSRQGAGVAAMTFLILAGALLICFMHDLFSHLVTDSNISFEAYKVLTISGYSVAGYVSVVLLFSVPVILFIKAFRLGRKLPGGGLALPLIASVAVVIACFYKNPGSLVVVLLLLLFMLLILRIAGRRKTSMFNVLLLLTMLAGLYSLYVITDCSDSKITENMKIQALSFSTENDPEAEHLLLDMWPEMMTDPVLREMMENNLFQENFSGISEYVRENYFGGYWGNYNYSIYLCRSDDPLELGMTGELVDNCFDFFAARVDRYGHRLASTGFFFIDNQAGRSYYLGQLLFKQDERITNGLFIELYNDINLFQPGYSELLLDRKFRGYSGLKDYSFAKYINGEIVLKSGDFAYSRKDDEYIDEGSDYSIFSAGKFRHILYRNGNATVILSRPELNAGNLLISFAYLFAFTFIMAGILMFLVRKPDLRSLITLNFRQKLHLAFTSLLFFSFIFIGIIIANLTISEYRANHDDNITEKLNSIYLELDARLADEKILPELWRTSSGVSLNHLLINLSNIFNTDINLYDLNGILMATSRAEIFTRDLTGTRMNNKALNSLKYLGKTFFSQSESIGNLKYVSVYVPYYNIDNEVLAYLNLPYFRMQSLLAREISNLIVAIINFTLLLVLITMGVAVFISGRLTSPLTMLSEGLASVELGKKSEHLFYKGNDEIGELVRQYNRMVEELDESARKLADSEREYAWREMAKQIAHEIKNPLTPMKLNVQQLLKAYKDGVSGFEDRLETFSRNQIEYIDNLSSIASAFSTFAKMPGTKPVEIDLLEQIRTTLELFRNTDNVTFRVQWPHESKVIIYADREHLNGIFSNLFKNSIQAIPPCVKGLVEVRMEIVRNRVVVTVKDNGTGIPDELKKKMFTPNFTTKSSGTGLGLSIVKKYAEGANGRVWFDSEEGKGTQFYVEFPLLYTVESPGLSHTE